VIVFASGGKRRLGYDSFQEGSGLFYNEKIPEVMGKHAVDRYLDFVRHLAREKGMGEAAEAGPEVTLACGPEVRQRMETLLGPYGDILGKSVGDAGAVNGGRPAGTGRRFVAVNPVAFWETKLWEDEKFAALCDRIRSELGVGVVLTGGERGPLDRIQSQMKTAAVNLGGRTSLRELACLYGQAQLVISTDSGPMHLAAAVGTPVVALFGPTDPARTGPYGPGHRVIRHALTCAPCLRKQCATVRCMREIGVDEVFDAVREELGKRDLREDGQGRGLERKG
jgi:3-deoxy-D-manno-octulosonic-acid transferase/heptosyltransferase-1